MAAAACSRIKVSCVWEEHMEDVMIPPTIIKLGFDNIPVNSTIRLSIAGELKRGEKKPLTFHILKQDGSEAEFQSLNFTAEQINHLIFRLNDAFQTRVETSHTLIEGVEYELRIESYLGQVILAPFVLPKEERVQYNVDLAEQVAKKLTLWMLPILSGVCDIFHNKLQYMAKDPEVVIYKVIAQMDQRVLEEIKASLEKVDSENSFIDFCILAFNRGLLSKISLTLAESKIDRELTPSERRAIGALTYRQIINLIGSDHSRRSQIQLLPGISLLG